MRVSNEDVFMAVAAAVSLRGTCPRRQVGCVLVTYQNTILATGFNGAPRGAVHCLDRPCPGAALSHGAGLDRCAAIHAEQNALIQCSDPFAIEACYTTAFPCMHCFKMLANTGCRRIVYQSKYPATEYAVGSFNSSLKNPMRIEKYGRLPTRSVRSEDDLASAILKWSTGSAK